MDLTVLQNMSQGKSLEPDIIDYSLESIQKKFPHITPTEKEIYKGQLYAYELATERQRQEHLAKNKQENIDKVKQMWTYEECFQYFEWAAEKISRTSNVPYKYQVDEYNKQAIHLLCLYFSNDQRFETYGAGGLKYSLKKGIMLQSPTRGTGKTDLLRCFAQNKRQGFLYKHVDKMKNDFAYKGFSLIEDFVDAREVSPTIFNFYQTKIGTMFDEMFDEGIANYMGTTLNISQYIINSLYDYKKGKDCFWNFHITTNYDGDAIEARLGVGIRSRIPEMFNIIKLEGPDRRRNKK